MKQLIREVQLKWLALPALALAWNVHAAVPMGTELPVKAIDSKVYKSGDKSKVRFAVVAPSKGSDPESLVAKLDGCTIEGDAAFNPRTGRLYIKRPVLTCGPETKVGQGFIGGDLIGQLSDSGLDGVKLDCPTAKECTVGSLKKDSEASFTVTETMGGGN